MLAGTDPSLTVPSGQRRAVYVTTGGPVPDGYVAVVPVEEAKVTEKTLDLRHVDSADYK